VVVSGDIGIAKSKHRQKAWLEKGCTCFFLKPAWSDQTLYPKTSRLVDRWPQIIEFAAALPSGAGFLVSFRGRKLEPIHP